MIRGPTFHVYIHFTNLNEKHYQTFSMMWQDLKKAISRFNVPADQLKYLKAEYKTAQKLKNGFNEKIKFYSDENYHVEGKFQITFNLKETLKYCENYIYLITDEIMRYEGIVNEFNEIIKDIFDENQEPVKKKYKIKQEVPTQTHEVKHYLSRKEICEWLHISPVTLWKMMKNGSIPYVRIGSRRLLFDESEVLKAIEQKFK